MKRTIAAILLLASAAAFAQTQNPRDPQPSFKDYVDLPKQAASNSTAGASRASAAEKPAQPAAGRPQPSFPG